MKTKDSPDIVLSANSTRFMAVQLRTQHPGWSLEDIAKQLDCSRQRVYDILKKANIPTRKTKALHHCKYCKKHIHHKDFCDNNCKELFKFDKYFIMISCDNCDFPKQRRRSSYKYALNVLKQKRFYCSRPCYVEDRNVHHDVER